MVKSFGILARGEIGRMAIKLFAENKEQLKFVVLDHDNFQERNSIIQEELAEFKDTQLIFYTDDDNLASRCREVDAVILAFWERLIKDRVLEAPRWGFLNLHTSFLPYGKGKNPHYWALVEENSYGVTIMKINRGLDTGEIIYQREIETSWTDTGKSLYFKGYNAMFDLLIEHRKEILELQFELKEQSGGGTFHYGKEMEGNSMIELGKSYSARMLLNILRARTFRPFPAAYFYDEGKKYEVTVKIEEVKEQFDKNKVDYKALLEENLNWEE